MYLVMELYPVYYLMWTPALMVVVAVAAIWLASYLVEIEAEAAEAALR